MRFGLQLHGTFPIDAYGPLAARAERCGFEDVSVHDLLMRRPVWPLLCDVARATARVAVGPNVTHPYVTHPAVIAANIAHLDELSDGRAVLGIGRGSLYEMVGVRPPSGLRGLEEAVHIIRRLLRHESGEWRGEVFALGPGHGLRFGAPRDVPVVFGTFGRRGAELAARIGDGIRAAAQWDPAYLVELRGWVHESAERAGRDPDGIHLVPENWTCLHPDRERARARAREILATFLPHLGPMLRFYGIADEEVAAARGASVDGDTAALETIRGSTIDRFMAAGDAEDLRRGLDAWEDAGFDQVSFSGILGPEPDLALGILAAELARRREGDGAGRDDEREGRA